MNMMQTKVMPALSRIKNKVVNATATALSAPAVAYYRNKQAKNDYQANILKQSRKVMNVDTSGKDYNDPTFRLQAEGSFYRSQAAQKAKRSLLK